MNNYIPVIIVIKSLWGYLIRVSGSSFRTPVKTSQKRSHFSCLLLEYLALQIIFKCEQKIVRQTLRYKEGIPRRQNNILAGTEEKREKKKTQN